MKKTSYEKSLVSRADPVGFNGEDSPLGQQPAGGGRLGRFELIELLGRGGYSSVYLMHDPLFDQTVAVKQLDAVHSDDPELRARFIGEARLARSIDSDRVVAIHDLGEHQGQPYLVMPRHDETLADRLAARERTVSPGSIAETLVCELHACLQAVEQAGVVHRDIKPSNLLIAASVNGGQRAKTPACSLLDPGERLVLADFGLARSTADTKITLGAGTVGFMAPEQSMSGIDLDHRADIFAATAVIANWMTTADANIGDELKTVFDRGMAYRREDRFSTADEWANAFHSAFAAQRPVLRHRSRWARVVALIAVAGALAAIAAAASASARLPKLESTLTPLQQVELTTVVATTFTETTTQRPLGVVKSLRSPGASVDTLTTTSVAEERPSVVTTVATSVVTQPTTQSTAPTERPREPCTDSGRKSETEAAFKSTFEAGSASLDISTGGSLEATLDVASSAEESRASAQLKASVTGSDC